MSDPLPFFHGGACHIFFQHNPNAPVWGDIHRGHAVSHDLIQWKPLPIALGPWTNSPDQDGVWNGSIIEHQGTFYLFYTGVPMLRPLRQTQCLAYSQDLVNWNKYEHNPVIPAPPSGVGECFRDPHVFRSEDRWLMLVGSEQPGRKGGLILLYQSRDLANWDFVRVFHSASAEESGSLFECPDLFWFGETAVLLASNDLTHWHTGTIENETFCSKRRGLIDDGSFSGGKTIVAADGRRLLFGWIREQRTVDEQVAAGWSGVLSFPREISLTEDGDVAQKPARELAQLRSSMRKFEGVMVSSSSRPIPLTTFLSRQFEAIVQFPESSDARVVGLLVRDSAGQGDACTLWFDRSELLGAAQGSDAGPRPGDFPALSLHLFVDHSVVECFVNDRHVRTRRLYPSNTDDFGLTLLTRDAETTANVTAWDLAVPSAVPAETR
jgi:beta-fructofuranosidase